MRFRPLPEHPGVLEDLLRKADRYLATFAPIVSAWRQIEKHLPPDKDDLRVYLSQNPVHFELFKSIGNHLRNQFVLPDFSLILEFVDWPFSWDYTPSHGVEPLTTPEFLEAHAAWLESLRVEEHLPVRSTIAPNVAIAQAFHREISARLEGSTAALLEPIVTSQAEIARFLGREGNYTRLFEVLIRDKILAQCVKKSAYKYAVVFADPKLHEQFARHMAEIKAASKPRARKRPGDESGAKSYKT